MDDARLATFLVEATAYKEDEIDWNAISDDDEEDNQGCPVWFARAFDNNADNLKSRKGLGADRPEHRAREQQLAAQLPPPPRRMLGSLSGAAGPTRSRARDWFRRGRLPVRPAAVSRT